MNTYMEQWSARVLARQFGLPHSTVSNWIVIGLVRPDKHGRGRAGHSIGVAGLLELVAVKDLRDAGVSVKQIQRAVQNLRKLTGQDRPLARLVLVVVGHDIIVQDLEDPSLVMSTLRNPGQRVMVFPIGEQHAQALVELRRPTTRSRPRSVPSNQQSIKAHTHE